MPDPDIIISPYKISLAAPEVEHLGETMRGRHLILAGDVTLADGVKLNDRLASLAAQIRELQEATKEAKATTSTNKKSIERLEYMVEQIVAHLDLVEVPAWRTQNTVENGDLDLDSASSLGLKVTYAIDQANPNYEDGEVIRISPRPGSLLKRGTEVTIEINLMG